MEKTIRKIESKQPVLPVRERVAAYARVSSGKDAMLHSLSAQVSYFSNLIQRNPEWHYVGVYVERCPLSLIQMHPKPILGCIFLREGCI